MGLHHRSTQCLFGQKLMLQDPKAGEVDLGRVGEVTDVEVATIENACLAGIVPVLPSLAEDDDGNLLNVNADTAAAAVARALKAEKLVFLTDTPGILMDRSEPESLIRGLTPESCRDLIDRGVIDRGMIPKVEACLTSLEEGVRKTHIIDGRLRHSLLLEIYTEAGIGTADRPERAPGWPRAAPSGRGAALTLAPNPAPPPATRRPAGLTTSGAPALASVAHQGSAETIAQFDRYVIPNYRRYPVCLVRGEGSSIWDAEGRRYLDFFPGWGCNLLGHCPPRVVEAVREQVGQLIHVPNTWYMEAQGAFAQALRAVVRRPGLDADGSACYREQRIADRMSE